MANDLPDIPNDMQKVQRRFEQWRSAHTGRLPIPERLWRAATELVLSDTSSRNYAPVSGHAFPACRTRYTLSSPTPLGPEG